jgi:hypothetical protein
MTDKEWSEYWVRETTPEPLSLDGVVTSAEALRAKFLSFGATTKPSVNVGGFLAGLMSFKPKPYRIKTVPADQSEGK